MGYDQIWAPWRMGYILGEAVAKAEKTAPAAQAKIELPAGGVPQCFLCCAVPEKIGPAAAPASDDALADDRARGVVARFERSIVVLNRYPYNNGHLLVAPRRHCATLGLLTAEEQLEISQTIAAMVQILEETLKPDGFNVGLNLGRAAGAGLPGHLHWHIVPRWAGDTNFMAVAAGVRVIPQSLEALWELLRSRVA